MYIAGNLNTGRWGTCMNNLSTTHVNSNVSTVTYDITRLHVSLLEIHMYGVEPV